MYFRLSNHVFMHVVLPIMLALSFLVPTGSDFRLAISAAALHEFWHVFAAVFLHAPILRLTFLPYGCHLRLGQTDFLSEARIAIAGPMGSLLLFLLFQHTDFGRINFTLFLINLLPALPLDGGRLFRMLLLQHCGMVIAARRMQYIGIFIGILLMLYAISRPSPFCGCIALLVISHPRLLPASCPLLQKKAVRITKVKMFHVRYTDSLLSLSRHFSPFYYAQFPVRGRNAVLTEETVIACLRRNAAARVSDALTVSPGRIPPLSGRHSSVSAE